jgi:fructose-specific phosphotransferase system IIC component
VELKRELEVEAKLQRSNEGQLLKGALTPTLIIGVIAIAVATYFRGSPGFIGALLAQVVVVIYFLVHLLVSKFSRDLDPMSTMAMAMLSYFAKILLAGAFFWILGQYTTQADLDRKVFGITAVALTFAWLGGEVASYLKLKTHLPLPHEPKP